MDSSSLHAELDAAVDDVADKVVEWRRHVHRHPELSNRESETAAYIAEHLRTLDFDEVRTGIAGHGVVGVLRGGQPGDRVVALRADIDALPVREVSDEPFASTVVDESYPGGPFPVSHACGHDCHVAMLMGAASVLSQFREQLAGTVLFIFQPAEEGPPVDETGGARAMIDEGAFTDPEPTMVFGMHVGPLPVGVVGYRVGNQFGASCLVKITVEGTQVHGSMPWMGVDPMPAVGAILTGIGQLYRQVDAFSPMTVSMGHIEDVGRFNIIGDTVTIWGTIRCTVESAMADVRERVSILARGSAEAYGCSASTEFLQEVPAVNNAEKWIEAARPTMTRVAGEEMVIQTPPTLGYDDVSELVNSFGGLYVMLGVQETTIVDGTRMVATDGGRGPVPNHNPRFYAVDEGLSVGVRLHAHVAVDHLAGELTGR